MDHLGVLGGIAGVFLLACLSPGPVWVVITSTSVAVSRRAGVLTGLGVAGATLTWAMIAMLGLGLFAQLTWLTTVIKLAGAAYLASITNPKAAAFFGSVFVVMLPAHAPAWVYAAAVVLLAVLSAGWHCGLAIVFSVAPIQAGYRKAKAKIDMAIGMVLTALGVRLALSR